MCGMTLLAWSTYLKHSRQKPQSIQMGVPDNGIHWPSTTSYHSTTSKAGKQPNKAFTPSSRQAKDGPQKKKKKRQADSSDRKRCCRIAGAAARGGKVVVCAVYWPGENCTGIPDFEGKEGNPPTKVAISPNKHIPI